MRRKCIPQFDLIALMRSAMRDVNRSRKHRELNRAADYDPQTREPMAPNSDDYRRAETATPKAPSRFPLLNEQTTIP